MNTGPIEIVHLTALGVWAQLKMLLNCFRSWPMVTARLAASRLLGRPPSGRPLSLRTRAGPVLTVPPGDGTWCTVVEVFGRDAYQLGDLQPDAQALVFVDVGANIGAFALDMCARWLEARVVCLEPAPGAFAHLVSNLEANGYAARVETVAAAITGSPDRSTRYLFECPSDSSTSTTVEAFAHAPASALGRWLRVPAVSLADAMADIEGVVDCRKLDAEGAEYEIVTGTRLDTLRQLLHVVVEYHPVPDRELAELVERFVKVGLAWTRSERSPEPGREVCWFAIAPGAP